MLAGNHSIPFKSSQTGNLPLTQSPVMTLTSKSSLMDQGSMTRSGPVRSYTVTTGKKPPYDTY